MSKDGLITTKTFTRGTPTIDKRGKTIRRNNGKYRTRVKKQINNSKPAVGIAPAMIKYGSEKLFRMIHWMLQRTLDTEN